MKKSESVFKNMLPAVVQKAAWVIVADGQEAVSGHVTEAEAVEKAKELAEERDWRGTRLTVHKVKAEADHREPDADDEPDQDDMPRVVATDKDGDDDKDADDDGEMTDDEKKRHGVAAAKRKAMSKVAKGTFKSAIFPDSREYPLEDQEGGDLYRPGRQVHGPSVGTDALNREYSAEVHARISGGQSRVEGQEPGYIPAGAGQTWNGVAGDENNGFRPMGAGEGDKGHSGGIDRGAAPVHPHGGYELISEGDEAGSVRVGDFAVLTPSRHGIALAASAKFPGADTRVLKSTRPKGLFRKVGGSDIANLG